MCATEAVVSICVHHNVLTVLQQCIFQGFFVTLEAFDGGYTGISTADETDPLMTDVYQILYCLKSCGIIINGNMGSASILAVLAALNDLALFHPLNDPWVSQLTAQGNGSVCMVADQHIHILHFLVCMELC